MLGGAGSHDIMVCKYYTVEYMYIVCVLVDIMVCKYYTVE